MQQRKTLILNLFSVCCHLISRKKVCHIKPPFLSVLIVTIDADELEWLVPAKILPEELQRHLTIISDFLVTPIDLGDKKASSLLQRKPRKRRRRRQASPTPSGSDAEDDEPRRKRREKKKKETKQYKSAQFIEDSDVEADEWERFFAKEKDLRERMKLAAIERGKESGAMMERGTKKRRRKGKQADAAANKRRKGSVSDDEDGSGGEKEPQSDSDKGSDDEGIFNPFSSPKPESTTARTSPEDKVEEVPPPKAKPKPRPRPKAKAKPVEAADVDASEVEVEAEVPAPPKSSSPPLEISDDEDEVTAIPRKTVKKKPLFLSDDED